MHARRGPALILGQDDPELEEPHAVRSDGVLAVDDPAPGRHPFDVARIEPAFEVLEAAAQHEGDGLEAGVGMRLAEVSADFRPVVGHQEERIGRSEIARRNHEPRGVARPGEAWPDRRRGEQAIDAAKYSHGRLFGSLGPPSAGQGGREARRARSKRFSILPSTGGQCLLGIVFRAGRSPYRA